MLKKKQIYPTKTSLNLNKKDIPEGYYRRITLYAILGIVLIAAFTQFAVVGRLSAASRAENEADAAHTRYQSLVAANAIYPDVLQEYEKYFSTPETAAFYVEAMDVLSLVDSHMRPVAGIQSLSLTDNVLSVILTGISLEQASDIVSLLSSNERVTSAYVSSIDTTSQEVSLVSMTVTLNAGGGNTQ